mgnify:CR=1 FL=1
MCIRDRSSPPCPPNRFYGSAFVNGKPAPTGMNVTAKINGVIVASTITVDGKYGYSPYIFDVPDNDNNCDNTVLVEFFIENKPAGQAMFENAKFTSLDLYATGVTWCGDAYCSEGETCSSCPEDCGECSQPSNPASGGSSGGGGFFVSQPEECIPEWECSPWSQCINGSQTRKCVDVNNCSTTENKPPEKQACGLKSILTEECESGITRCVGKSLWKCENGVWKKIYECENGCSNGKCIESIEQNISSSTTNNKSSFPIAGLFTEEIKETLTAILLLIVIIIAILIYKIKFK